jgi:hypothetical protein
LDQASGEGGHGRREDGRESLEGDQGELGDVWASTGLRNDTKGPCRIDTGIYRVWRDVVRVQGGEGSLDEW